MLRNNVCDLNTDSDLFKYILHLILSCVIEDMYIKEKLPRVVGSRPALGNVFSLSN